MRIGPAQGNFFRKFKWKARYSILLMMWAYGMFAFLDMVALTVALPYIGAEFKISTTAQGLIVSMYFAGFMLFLIPGGFIIDRFSLRSLLGISITLRSIFMAITACAFSYPLMLMARFMYGTNEAVQPSVGIKTIALYFPMRERGTANAIRSTNNTLGPALATIIATIIISVFGWRAVFFTILIPNILLGIIIFKWFRDKPADYPRMTKKELVEIEGGLGSKDYLVSNQARVTSKQFLTQPILWQLVLILFFFDITFFGFISWIPSYLMSERAFSLQDISYYGTIPYLVGTLTLILGGYLSDKFQRKVKWIYALSSLLSGLALFIMLKVSSTFMLVFFQCVAAFFMFMAFGVFTGLQIANIPVQIMGVCSSIITMAGQLAGVISPFVMGYLIESTGSYNTAFFFIIIAMFVSSIVSLTIRNKSENVENNM